jgi:two-component system, LytTR family, response regulator
MRRSSPRPCSLLRAPDVCREQPPGELRRQGAAHFECGFCNWKADPATCSAGACIQNVCRALLRRDVADASRNHGIADIMQQLRVVIADDERLSRRALRAQLEKREDIVIVAECGDGRTALAAIEREEPDLVFLDVRMPHLDGFELLERIESGSRPAVIFVTAYDEHAIRAFDVQAIDYLLKPFDASRLNAAVDRALSRRREETLSTRVESALGHLQPDAAAGGRRWARRLLVRQSGRASFVNAVEIDWIEAAGNDVRLHVGERSHLMKAAISELERKLDPSQFMRIHRSTIVNLDRIGHIEPYGGSDYQVVLRDGTKLRVSRSSRDRLLKDTL